GPLLRLVQLLDVDGRADVPEQLALRPQPRAGPVEHPPVLPVVPAQAVLAGVLPPGRGRGAERRTHTLAVVRVDALGPAEPAFLLQPAPAELQPRGAE